VIDKNAKKHNDTNRRDYPSTCHVIVQGLRVVLDQSNEAEAHSSNSIDTKSEVS
jgi:hypothetical protein